MNINVWIRQGHRWLSIVFTVTVIANFAILGMNESDRPMWVVYSPLIPLFLMLFSGLYMFALPYTAKWRSATRQRRKVTNLRGI
ncbi:MULTISPECIES: hypothetical protein [unclassified Rhizobium]|uniref:hypothetical protein n=1 Tax=unclassified Rhizobium TaxID=2613769 RepID=UPI00382B49D7